MTVTDPDRLDLVLGKDGQVILAMVEARPFDGGAKQRDEIRRKIVSYLAYMRSDAFRERFGDPSTATIMLVASSEPPEDIMTLMANAAKSSGVGITFEKGPEPPPLWKPSPQDSG